MKITIGKWIHMTHRFVMMTAGGPVIITTEGPTSDSHLASSRIAFNQVPELTDLSRLLTKCRYGKIERQRAASSQSGGLQQGPETGYTVSNDLRPWR